MPLYRILFLIDLWFKDVKLHLTLKNKQKTNIQEFKKKNIQLFSCFLCTLFFLFAGRAGFRVNRALLCWQVMWVVCVQKKTTVRSARSQRGSDNVSVVLLRADPCRLFNSSHFLHVSLTRRRALRARWLWSFSPATQHTQHKHTTLIFIWDMCVCVCVCMWKKSLK